MRRHITMVLVLFAVGAGTAAAQQPPPGQRGTTWSLGAGVLSAPRPYVDASAEVRPIPLLELYSGRFFIQGIRTGYRVVDGDRLDFDLRARFRFSALDPDDSPALEGMDERRETVEAGIGLDWDVGANLSLKLRAFADVLGRSDGAEASVDLSWRKVFGPGRVILSPSLGLVWQSSDQVGYYYGVRPEEARLGRPAYSPRDVVNPRASVFALFRIDRRWAVTTLVSYDLFDDEITGSPIIDANGELFGIAGLVYRF